jgi:hypothetical protein
MGFAFDIAQQGDNALMDQAANNPLDTSQLQAKSGVASAIPRGVLAGAVRLASGLDLAASVVPIAIDAVAGNTKLEDQYFAEHDATFGRTMKVLTPTPETTTTAGRIAFGITQGLTELVGGGPRGLVASEELNTGADMVSAGVDSSTALLLGDAAGITNAVGAGIPAAFGKTLMARLVTGAAGNVAAGAAGEAAQKGVLQANGYNAMADQVHPLDARARLVDLVMGAAFGGLHHLQVPTAAKPAARDAAATLNLSAQAEASAPGDPVTSADFSAHLDAHQKAQDDLQHDRPVDVSAQLDGAQFNPSAHQDAVRANVQKAADEVTTEIKSADPEAFLTPDQITAQQHAADIASAAKELGITEAQAKALAAKTEPKALRDMVTGLYEARVGEGDKNLRLASITRAQKLVEQTGAPATYVHADIANLGGLNSALTESGANKVFKMAATFFQDELAKIGASAKALAFRHGGDEISGVVMNATERDAAEALRKAAIRVKQAAKAMRTAEGGRVSEIPHPKHPGVAEKQGTGLSYGVSEIRPNLDRADIIKRAEVQLEAMKKEVPHVNRSSSAAAGPEPSGGQAGGATGRAGGGTEAPGRQNEGGQRGLPGREAGQSQLPEGLNADAVAAAEQAVAADPTVPAIDEATGQHVPAGELLAKLDTEIQDAEKKRSVFSAAVACFLRNGGF